MMGTSNEGKPEKIFYIQYYRDGKRRMEKAGLEVKDGKVGKGGKFKKFDAAMADAIHTDRMRGKELSNKEQREKKAAAKKAEAGWWTFDKLWTQWKAVNTTKKGIVNDDNRYRVHLQPLIREQGTEGHCSPGRYPAESQTLERPRPATGTKV